MRNDTYYSKDGTISAHAVGRGAGDKTIFMVGYPYSCTYEEHEIKLYEWAKHLHGNAPAGTPYGYFRASRNGKRVIITV